MEVAGSLGTPLGLAQRKRASPRGEAGTSGFLCVSDSDLRVPAELGQESHEVAQLCLTPGDPMDCSLPGSSVHGIFQARVLEWGVQLFVTPWTVAHQAPLSMELSPGDTGNFGVPLE